MRHLAAVLAAACSTACAVIPALAAAPAAESAPPAQAQPARPPAAAGRIEVLGATYGFNYRAPKNNAAEHMTRGCNGKSRCNYRVDAQVLGDPAPGCQKDFNVTWRCGPAGTPRHEQLPPEAGFGSVVTLDCG
jgi:hypothetical protein